MARILCNVAGGGKPLKGNAETGDVLAGKTFSNKQSNALTGSMPSQGLHQSSTGVGGGSGSLYAYMPYGYYDNYNNSGNAWIDITNDQAKTLANNAGVGYNSGYANGNAHVTYTDFRVTAQAASENADSSKTFNAHLNGYTMIGYGLIRTGGVGWNWWRPYTFNISNYGENITVSVSGDGGGYDSTGSDPSRWKNLDCTVRVFYK